MMLDMAAKGRLPDISRRLWLGNNLPGLREQGGLRTFYEFQLDDLPMRPDACGDDLHWLLDLPEALNPIGHPAEGQLETVASQVALPDNFQRFLRDPSLHGRVDSSTSAWLTLALFDVGADGHLVLFLRDQQDCVLWFLHLPAAGEPRVLAGWDGLDEWYEAGEPLIWASGLGDLELVVCAESFADFVYHYAVESALWFSTRPKSTRTPGTIETAYASFFSDPPFPLDKPRLWGRVRRLGRPG